MTPPHALGDTHDAQLSPLVALLNEEPLLAGVPERLWEAALLGPLREFLSRPGKALRARLVQLGYTLGGGQPQKMPAQLPLLIEILHAGSLIVDDIEDGSALRRGAPALHRVHGVPVALNAGNWLYFWPQVLLGRMPLPRSARLEAHDRISACLLRCHEGQALDLTVRVDELARHEVAPVVRAITTLKTGELVGLACALGAIAAGAPEQRVAALARFGCDAGIALQMLDDLSGALNPARRDKALEDLRQHRATFVWAQLCEDLDSASYHEALALLRAGEHDELLAIARFRLAMTGLLRTRRAVDDAVSALAHAIGDGGWSHGVRAELSALERAFMEGT
jgi:geranylgeranyl pyrophosphate synthase